MTAVQVRQLRKTYGSGETKVQALNGIDLSLAEGEFVSVMGPSGCGKSTLLHLIGGLDSIDSGEIEIGGERTEGLGDRELTLLRRRRIGVVFQYYNLVPVLSALENTALPLILDGMKKSEAEERALVWLERFGLKDRARHLPSQLSGGQQQRVALARALVMEPRIVLADEPTGNLDSLMADEVVGMLRKTAKEFGRAVLMVTHDSRMAAWADRIVFMKDGLVVEETLLGADKAGKPAAQVPSQASVASGAKAAGGAPEGSGARL
jgi:putative ABC transport system ATP-binding protein